MRLGHLLLAMLIVLLAISNGIDAASTNGVTTTVTTEKIRNVVSFEDASPNKRESTGLSSAEEERGAAGTAAAAGAPAGVSFPVRDGVSEGQKTIVTTYNGNGLLQKFMKWWRRHFGNDAKASRSTRRLRQTTK
ncbi:hypothetical protein PRIC2_011472 [Phytophthora ramorum]